MWVIVSTFIFITVQFIGGDVFGLSRSGRCFALLGCNAGFFGYDAFVHFVAGITLALLIIWLGKVYPGLRVISANFWKSVIIVIALCALIETGWEVFEFGVDHVRMDILHQNLVSANQLLQTNNSDTMGDETFNLIGGVVAIIMIALFQQGVFTDETGQPPETSKIV